MRENFRNFHTVLYLVDVFDLNFNLDPILLLYIDSTNFSSRLGRNSNQRQGYELRRDDLERSCDFVMLKFSSRTLDYAKGMESSRTEIVERKKRVPLGLNT